MNIPWHRAFTWISLVLVIFLLSPTFALGQTEFDLIVNYIEATPVEGQMAYDVTATFSLLDSAGNPIKDLQLNQVSLSEDGQGVTAQSLETVTDQPIFVSLLIDTSGSMSGLKVEEAKKAAQQFVDGLNPNDRISITTFNSDVELLIDLSSDHEAVKSLIGSIKAKPGSGTCLYDALYGAIQRTAAFDLGRRAVIVLSDGKDELPAGGVCSKLTLDDAIDLASEGNTRVPVFAIGLGQSVDEQGLSRLALLTGGRFDKTPDATQLGSMFTRLLDLLQSQYILHYTSTAAPGNHTLVLNTKYLNSVQTDSRDFILPSLPLHLTIISPTTGAAITDQVKIVTAITGQGKPIKEVVFSVNDVVIGTDDSTPYELEWAPSNDFKGDVTINVVAMGMDNAELARASVVASLTSKSNQLPVTTPTPTVSTGFFTRQNIIILSSILAALLVCIVVIVIMTEKKRKENRAREKQWQDGIGGSQHNSTTNEMTMDSFILSEDSLGVLIVMQSDDPSMIGQRFEITEKATRLGRAVDNEILFPKDGPVSRHHALIESKNGVLILSEMVSPSADGTTKPPTFGTFINDKQISEPTPLQNGDLIRLGKRVILKFEANDGATEPDDPRTMDNFEVSDPEKTMDSL